MPAGDEVANLIGLCVNRRSRECDPGAFDAALPGGPLDPEGKGSFLKLYRPPVGLAAPPVPNNQKTSPGESVAAAMGNHEARALATEGWGKD